MTDVTFYCLPGVNGMGAMSVKPARTPWSIRFTTWSWRILSAIFKVNFPVRPGETRFDLNYTTPYTAGTPYAGKVPSHDENTYLIVPKGVTLTGDNLSDMGQEPRTEAHLFGVKENSYQVTLSGVAEAAPQDSNAGSDSSATDPGNQIQEVMPRVLTQVKPILGLALGILALGFVLLYRTSTSPSATKEPNERRRG